MPAAPPTLRAQLERTGFRRTGGPRNGYRYQRSNGAKASASDRARISGLRVPDGWRDVVIASDRSARLQAVGRDAAGRWQYLYLARHSERRSRRKFDRLLAFARALPALRATLRRDLARHGLRLERACAAAVLLLSAAALRAGSERNARAYGTFGLATLRPEHVSVRGAVVQLRYPGKRGVPQLHELRGARLAALVREQLALPGRELFKYRDARGRLRDLRHEHLNAYLQHAMGTRFTARDFRTWHAALVCAGELRAQALALGPRFADAPRAALRSALKSAMAATAHRLGNTLAVTRESYVHPGLVRAFREGRVVARTLPRSEALAERVPVGLHPAERALLRLLERA